MLTSAKLDATGHRWIAALSSYNFDIIYRPGKSNADADGLSRLPGLFGSKTTDIGKDSVKAICNLQHAQPYAQSLAIRTDKPVEPSLPSQKLVDVKTEQHRDSHIRNWIYWVSEHRKPAKEQMDYSPLNNWFLNNFDKLRIVDGVLYREVTVNGETLKQLVLPEACISTVMTSLHDDMGHQGRDKTLSLVRDRFIWYGMTRDIDNWIANCERCIRRKQPANDRAPLINIETSQPLELVCMDYLSLERSKGGYDNILVITDHFTRYALAIPTKNQTAKTTAEAFFNNFVVHYGLPRRIHSDQGANFESKIIKELCHITGMEKSRTTPYHPMENGLTERFNRTLLSMLGTLQTTQKKDWKSHVSGLVHAYNCTRQTTTGFSPYFLVFGRHPRLPVDIAFGIEDSYQKQPSTKYAEAMKDRLRKAYDLAARSARTAQSRQKQGYDKRARGAILQPGDRVLVKVVAFDGKHKIADRWEEDTYRIVSQPNVEIPVYVVQKENGEGRKRTLHRNLLLPIGHLPGMQKAEKLRRTPAPRKATRSKHLDDEQTKSDSSKEVTEESDEESEQGYIVYMPGDAQSNTNSDAEPVVEGQQGTVTQDDDDQNGDDGVRGNGFVEDALPPADDKTGEPLLAADVVTGQEATDRNIESDTSDDHGDDENDGSELPGTSGDTADEEEPLAPTETPQQPRQRRRRLLPTPPGNIPIPTLERHQRNRRPPEYLRDFVTKQAVIQPDWIIKVDWLTSQLEKGIFKGMEMEISRTIIDIVRNST